MRRIVIFVILLAFNFLFIYGVNYANQIMLDNNFVISLEKKDDVIDPTSNDTNENDIIENNSFNGESIDSIAQKMNNVFGKSYLEGRGKEIASYSIKKGVNPYLVGGIILESTNCQIECSVLLRQCNNVAFLSGGPGCFGGTYKKYSDIKDSINDLVDRISDRYDTGMQDVYKMYKSYGKNETWAYKVSKYMDILKRG